MGADVSGIICTGRWLMTVESFAQVGADVSGIICTGRWLMTVESFAQVEG